MGNHYSAQQFIKAIPGTGGIITAIAQRVGCEWHTAKKYITTYATIAQAYADEQERVLDRAESVLITSINEGNTQDAKWMLSRKGKHRGYGDNLSLTGEDGGPVETRLVVVFKDDSKRIPDNTTNAT